MAPIVGELFSKKSKL